MHNKLSTRASELASERERVGVERGGGREGGRGTDRQKTADSESKMIPQTSQIPKQTHTQRTLCLHVVPQLKDVLFSLKNSFFSPCPLPLTPSTPPPPTPLQLSPQCPRSPTHHEHGGLKAWLGPAGYKSSRGWHMWFESARAVQA